MLRQPVTGQHCRGIFGLVGIGHRHRRWIGQYAVSQPEPQQNRQVLAAPKIAGAARRPPGLFKWMDFNGFHKFDRSYPGCVAVILIYQKAQVKPASASFPFQIHIPSLATPGSLRNNSGKPN